MLGYIPSRATLVATRRGMRNLCRVTADPYGCPRSPSCNLAPSDRGCCPALTPPCQGKDSEVAAAGTSASGASPGQGVPDWHLLHSVCASCDTAVSSRCHPCSSAGVLPSVEAAGLDLGISPTALGFHQPMEVMPWHAQVYLAALQSGKS